MPRAAGSKPLAAALRTITEVSAGGVAFRRRRGVAEIALISVGDPARWQLPKGLVDRGERPEQTAVREVREEAGIESILIAPLDRIGYWYQRSDTRGRVRVRKFVHFFLLKYRSGRIADHDHEVREARWVPLADASAMLAFASERKIVEQAVELLESSAA